MSVSFGFSAGDFIAALELVADVIDALRESGEAGKRYRELVRQLDSLESVLLQVKRLELDEAQYAEYIALQQTSSQCQRTIDEFWEKIKKYQPALGMKGSSRLKDSWMRIRWAVCKKEDVNAFKADIAAHTESIHLLLTTIQMSRASLLEEKNYRRNLSLAGKIQAGYFELMKKVSAVFEATSTGIEQGKQLISTTSRILQMNVQIFQAVLNLQNFITRIPAQVERQQPVYLIDALGRQSPFHLEFIRSAEALTAVLQANLKTGQARKKIGRGEFVIQDSLKQRDINILDNWDKCFYPGQRVEMSVVYQRRWQAGNSCPSCGMMCNGSAEADVKCPKCEMTFRRIIKIEEDESPEIHDRHISQSVILYKDSPVPRNNKANFFPTAELPRKMSMLSNHEGFGHQTTPNRKRKREYARDGELELDLHVDNIRRVRIQTMSRGVTKRFEVIFGYFEDGGKPEPALCRGFRTEDDESCLIIEFEDNKSNALCDTINQQVFKLGGLFHTDLVTAESMNEEAEENDKQITWMEEDEVQMYLRFKSDRDRQIIWAFISSALDRWWLRSGELKPSQQGQSFMTTKTSPGNSEQTLLSMSSELTKLTESKFSVLEDKNDSLLLNIPGDCESMPRLVELSDHIWRDGAQNQNIQDILQESGLYESSSASLFPQGELWPSQGSVQGQLLDGSYLLVEDHQVSDNGIPTPRWGGDLEISLLSDSATINSIVSDAAQSPWPPSGATSSNFRIPSPERDKLLSPIIVEDPNDTVAMKRARNTLAARKSRQRKMTRFDELEKHIAKLEAERDHWRSVAVARNPKKVDLGNTLRRDNVDLASTAGTRDVNMDI